MRLSFLHFSPTVGPVVVEFAIFSEKQPAKNSSEVAWGDPGTELLKHRALTVVVEVISSLLAILQWTPDQ